MPTMMLTMQRSAQIDWMVKGSHHCGPESEVTWFEKTNRARVGVLRMQYSVKLVCTPQLDGRGFLFDQMDIHNFIVKYGREPRPESCEQAVINLANGVSRFVKLTAPHTKLHELSMTLSPPPFQASMTALLSDY